jgi:hypothetical protein
MTVGSSILATDVNRIRSWRFSGSSTTLDQLLAFDGVCTHDACPRRPVR